MEVAEEKGWAEDCRERGETEIKMKNEEQEEVSRVEIEACARTAILSEV